MLSIKDAQKMMGKLLHLRKISEETKSPKDIKAYKAQLTVCFSAFEYLIRMRTYRYKAFSNYEDLNQDGQEALLKAIKTYDPSKGNFFAWAHRYIGTRVSRHANLHTTIRVPLKIAKKITPHRENALPLQIEEVHCPDKQLEGAQVIEGVHKMVASCLSEQQQQIIRLMYGLDGNVPMSITRICQRLRMPRVLCVQEMEAAMDILKENVTKF